MLNEIIINVTGSCRECDHDTLLYDQHHNVIFCNKCGLVQKDSTPPGITQLIEDVNREELERQILIGKFKEMERNQMLMLNKQGNCLFNDGFIRFGKI